ncbi:DeoR/GlpR family DNA-binding transcription regulator [Oryzobacter terrae]|uniref:DeoR/GlpR family DNA-binding transcription regulator n=1 Tax=Oryzobacter terrae TaxID=1620385 RepID=UPI003672F7E2
MARPRHGEDPLATDPDATMSRAERLHAISEAVITAGSVRIEDLPESFGVSLMTIHRDLDHLAAQGLLRKTRGLVTALGSSLAESSTEYRARLNTTAKRTLARAAVELVEPGQVLILDDSTTGLHLADLLPERQPLTVMTNFQPMLDALVGNPDLNLISLGGQYYPWCRAYMGSLTVDALANVRADLLIMSTSAITDDVCFHQHHDTVLVKRAMFTAARRRVLYVDHSKFEQRALHALLPLREFDTVIVDADTPAEHLERLEGQGIELVVAARD